MSRDMARAGIHEIDQTRWKAAQEFELEFARRSAQSGDDYNHWWSVTFDGYHVLRGRHLPSVLEVGCGPHTNLRLILPLIQAEKVYPGAAVQVDAVDRSLLRSME